MFIEFCIVYCFYSISVLVLEVPCERFKWCGAFVSRLHHQSWADTPVLQCAVI